MSETPTPTTNPAPAAPPVTPTWPAEGVKLLHFTLGWVGPCKTYTNVILPRLVNAGLSLPIDTRDVDEHQDLAHRYDIRCVPTLIMLGEDDRVLGTLLGMRPEPTLRAWLAKPDGDYPL